MFYEDENLIKFLEGAEEFNGWFEVWVDLTPTDGIQGVIIRGAVWGQIHFDENQSDIRLFSWEGIGLVYSPLGEPIVSPLR